MQKLEGEGFDLFHVQDYLEARGLPSMDDYIIKDNFLNPQYVNPLKGMPVQP